MSCEFICDGCGARKKVGRFPGGWFKPSEWFERADADGAQVACSRRCIEIVAQKSGKTDLVSPL